ncbi:hypothetical protein BGW41_006621 [Actinomortierella wolfii]|nr:hypothetical protein BGW41_006621 [Actinomortierella wolfii]
MPAACERSRASGWPFASSEQEGPQDKNCDGLSDMTIIPTCQGNRSSHSNDTQESTTTTHDIATTTSTGNNQGSGHRRTALGSGGRFHRYGSNHYGYDIEQQQLEQQQQQQQQQQSQSHLAEDEYIPTPQKNEQPAPPLLQVRTKQLWYALPKQQVSPSYSTTPSDLLSPTPSTMTTSLEPSHPPSADPVTATTSSSTLPSSSSSSSVAIDSSKDASPQEEGEHPQEGSSSTVDDDDEETRRLLERQRHHRVILSGADSAVSLTGDEDLTLRYGIQSTTSSNTTTNNNNNSNSNGNTATGPTLSMTRAKTINAVATTLGFPGYHSASSGSDHATQHSSSVMATPTPTGKYQQPPPPINKSRTGSLSSSTGGGWRRTQQAFSMIRPLPQQMHQPLLAASGTSTTVGAHEIGSTLPPQVPPQRPPRPPPTESGDDAAVVVDMGGGATGPPYPSQRLPYFPTPTGIGNSNSSSGGGKTGWEREDNQAGGSIFGFFRGRKSSLSASGVTSSSKGASGLATSNISYPIPMNQCDLDLAPPRPIFFQSATVSTSTPSPPSTIPPTPKARSSSLSFASSPFSAKGTESSTEAPTATVTTATAPPPLSSSSSSTPAPTASLAQTTLGRVAAAVVGATFGKRRSSVSSGATQNPSSGGGRGGITIAPAVAGTNDTTGNQKKKGLSTLSSHQHQYLPQSAADNSEKEEKIDGASGAEAAETGSSSCSELSPSPSPSPLQSQPQPTQMPSARPPSTTSSSPTPASRLSHYSLELETSSIPAPGLTSQQLEDHPQHLQRLQQAGPLSESVVDYIEQLYRTIQNRDLALTLAQQQTRSLQKELEQMKLTTEQDKQALTDEVEKTKEQMRLMDENFMAWRTKVHNEQLIIQEEYLHERLIKQDRIEELEEELRDSQDEARRLRERLMALEYEDGYTGSSFNDRTTSHSEDEHDDDDYDDDVDDDDQVDEDDDIESQRQSRHRRRRSRHHVHGIRLTSEPGPMTLATHKRRSQDFQQLEQRALSYEQQVAELLKQLEQQRAEHQQVLVEFRMRMHNKCLKLEEQVQQAKVEALMYTEMMHELAMENEDLRHSTASSKGKKGKSKRRADSSSWRSFFDFNHEPVDEDDEEDEDEDEDEDNGERVYDRNDMEKGRINDSHMVDIDI